MALVLVLAAAGVAGAAKEHVAERFEVWGQVRADGSLEVTEVIAFRFTGGDYTAVRRELRATESDGVEILEASMDGRVLPRGDDAGHVEIRPRRGRVRVVWHFAPARDRVHVFTLRYRYAGVVRQGEADDWFRWPPFPARFDYPIETGVARLTWPEGARLRRAPGVEGPAALTSSAAGGIELAVANYRQRDDDVRLTVRFEPGVFTGPEPRWERDAARARQMAPAFVAGGAMILAAAGLALWVFFLRYRRDGIDPAGTRGPVTEPPDDLPPALAGSITSGRVSVAWPQLFGAVFELARRGVLEIAEAPGERPSNKRRFRIRRAAGGGALRPHEQVVVGALFTDDAREEEFARALRRLGGRAGKVRRAVQAELSQARLLDDERMEGATALGISGGVVMVFSAVLAAVLAGTGLRLGEASLFVPGALFLAGLTMVIIAAGFSTLTPAGLRASRDWDAYRRHLKHEIRARRLPESGDRVGRLLPYAAALGLLSPFGKALQTIDVRDVPPWLRSLDAAGGPANAAIVAVIAAGSTSVSHGAAGGSGAGGVGAGGSSGAH